MTSAPELLAQRQELRDLVRAVCDAKQVSDAERADIWRCATRDRDNALVTFRWLYQQCCSMTLRIKAEAAAREAAEKAA